MPADDLDILTDAIARNAAIVLSLPSAGMLRHHKSRFLAECPEGIWLESIPADTALIDALAISKQPVGISFKGALLKTAFAVPIVRCDPAYAVNAQTTVQAVLVSRPLQVKTVQRRNTYRVHVPEGCAMQVRIWRIADHAIVRDRPLASAEVKVIVRDLSVGGLGIVFQPRNEDSPALVTDQRLRVEVKYEDVELILDATLRHKPGGESKTGARAGIQFRKLENDLAGRQAIAALTRIVGELQREEVRRARLGLKQAS